MYITLVTHVEVLFFYRKESVFRYELKGLEKNLDVPRRFSIRVYYSLGVYLRHFSVYIAVRCIEKSYRITIRVLLRDFLDVKSCADFVKTFVDPLKACRIRFGKIYNSVNNVELLANFEVNIKSDGSFLIIFMYYLLYLANFISSIRHFEIHTLIHSRYLIKCV